MMTPLYGFSGEKVDIMGSVQLPVTLGESPKIVTRQVLFIVIKSTSVAYNIIRGRPILNDMRVIISPCYLLMKFPTPNGVGQVRGDQKKARTCYITSTTCRGIQHKETLIIDEPPKPKPDKEVEGVCLFEGVEDRKVFIGKQIERGMKAELVSA